MAKSIRYDIESRNRTDKAFDAVKRNVGSLEKSFGGLKAAVASVVGVGAFGAFAKSTLDSSDAIGKFADRAGITTTQLQTMRHAFDLAGVGVESVDRAMIVFGKRLEKARDGIGALKGGLKGNKEALLDNVIAAKSTSQALDIMFKAMGDAKNAAERLAIADAAFGDAGLRMTSAFLNGSEAFDLARQEALDLGLVLEDKLIRNAEKLNDDYTKASGIIGTQLKSAFLELAPAISKAFGALGGFLRDLREVEKINDNFNSLGIALVRTQDKIKNIKSELEKSDLKRFYTNLWLDSRGELEKQLKQLQGFEKALLRMRDAGRVDVQGKMTLANPKVANNVQSLAKSTFEFTTALDGLEDRLESKAFRQMAEDTAKAKRIFEATRTPLEQYNAKIKEYSELAGQGAIDADTFNRAVGAAQTVYEDSFAKIESKSKDSFSVVGDLAKSTGRDIEDSMVDALTGVESRFKSFGDFAGSILRDVVSGVLRAAVVRPLVQAGVDAFTNGLPHFANGGIIGAGQLSVVGERGPELFMPDTGGQIIPNHKLRGGGPGGGGNRVAVTFNIRANDSRGFDQLLTQRKGMIVGMINEAFNRRGKAGI